MKTFPFHFNFLAYYNFCGGTRAFAENRLKKKFSRKVTNLSGSKNSRSLTPGSSVFDWLK